jgi:acetate kinase
MLPVVPLAPELVTLLTVNTGSTSVKLALYELRPGGAPAQTAAEHHSGASLDAASILRALGGKLGGAPQLVVHRVVHGGTRFSKPTRIDPAVLAGIEALTPLAPLHNPKAVSWVRAAQAVWGDATLQLAVFDTAYFATLPRVAAEYALAPSHGVLRGVRRYGFHGLAHESLWRGWCRLNPQLPQGGRLITLQLGGGCSVAAIDHGRPVDTSMGFSPLEGLVMATRCGDLDPAVVSYLQQQLSLPGAAVIELLESQSGLKGLSGTDLNPSELLDGSDSQGQFAVALYCYRVRKYLGAYFAVLSGCDGVVFGGGVGEHEPRVRAAALEGLAAFGAVLDPQLNAAARGGAARISQASATIPIQVLESDEESILAEAGGAFLAGGPGP